MRDQRKAGGGGCPEGICRAVVLGQLARNPRVCDELIHSFQKQRSASRCRGTQHAKSATSLPQGVHVLLCVLGKGDDERVDTQRCDERYGKAHSGQSEWEWDGHTEQRPGRWRRKARGYLGEGGAGPRTRKAKAER